MPIQNHDYHIPLEDKANVWRYLDLEKFENLLQTKSLFFCRAAKFSDPYEFSIPKREAEFRVKEQHHLAKTLSMTITDEQANKNVANLTRIHLKMQSNTVVNCWHINTKESDAMWRLYTKNNEGVAIRSTKERIITTLNVCGHLVGISKVRYLDYEKDIWYDEKEYPHKSYNFTYAIIHKRLEFVHEAEFRIYSEIKEAHSDEDYWKKQKNNIGLFIPVSLESLIEEIILPPNADGDAEIKIKTMLINYGINKPLRRSTMENPAYF